MSRVHCIDCGSAVVVDPSGFCPDGHHLGADGARIDAAIGVAVPYPDEPEPWVAVVDDAAGADPGSGTVQPRAARPPSVPSGEPASASRPHVTTASPPHSSAPPFTTAHDLAPVGAPASSINGDRVSDGSDDLLRELHSLAELDDWTGPAAPAPTPSAPTAPASAPPLSAPTTSPFATPSETPPATAPPEPAATGDDLTPPPTNGQHRDGLAELRALEAAVHALTGSSVDELDDAAPEPAAAADGVVHRLPAPEPASPQETPDREELAEVEQLFAHRPAPATTDEPSPRPSLVTPPAQNEAPRPSHVTPPAQNETPRPAFERTPWSTTDLDDAPASATPSSSHPAAGSRPSSSRPTAPPPAAATAPPVESRTKRGEAPGSSDTTLDIGNFTAKGKRVGARGEGRRRRRGR